MAIAIVIASVGMLMFLALLAFIRSEVRAASKDTLAKLADMLRREHGHPSGTAEALPSPVPAPARAGEALDLQSLPFVVELDAEHFETLDRLAAERDLTREEMAARLAAEGAQLLQDRPSGPLHVAELDAPETPANDAGVDPSDTDRK